MTARNDALAAIAARVMLRCDELACCSDEPDMLARTFCSPAMREAHGLVSGWMAAAGMTTRVDAAGNLIGTYLPPGCDSQRRVMIGSHLDTVIDAGRYDGILGVMLGIATVEALRAADAALPWAVEVIGFSEEEGVRFGAPFIGSRALTGTLDVDLLGRIDASGKSVAEALAEFGSDIQALAECALASEDLVAFIEPHIEQGPQLEAADVPLGVVTAIAGQTRLTIAWNGPGGHAGTVPMGARSDAFTAACRWALAVEEVGRAIAGLVATVGRVVVEPNASNCIPRRVTLSLDVRHDDDVVRIAAVTQLVERAKEIAREGELEVSVQTLHEHAAVGMDLKLTNVLAAVVAADGAAASRLVSGAGHDAGVMAGVAPTAMLFVRCLGGVSHDPAESVSQHDVAAAIEALVCSVEALAMTAEA